MQYTAAIQGDNSSVYADGTPSVIATLFLRDAQTLDATLTLGSSRTAHLSFAQILATNENTPSWAAAGSSIAGARRWMFEALGDRLYRNRGTTDYLRRDYNDSLVST
jgi:hypothetical protein